MTTTRTIPAWGTKIEWCDATVNFWQGCAKVSEGCRNCYAADRDHRWHGGIHWGKGAPRLRGKGAVAKALALENRARLAGTRLRVFTNSLADMFDAEVPDAWRDTAHAVMALTSHLDWIIVTKRPEVAARYYAATDLYDRVLRAANEIRTRHSGHSFLSYTGVSNPADAAFNRNRWCLVSVENQQAADERIPKLLFLPFAVRGVSLEPMLGPVNLRRVDDDGVGYLDALAGLVFADGRNEPIEMPRLDWVINGGESGPHARPLHPDHPRAVRDDCAETGTAYFFKQWGEWLPWEFDEQHFNDVLCSQDGSELWFDSAPRDPLNLPKGWEWFYDDNGVPTTVLHQRVGKKAAGRKLDGVEHNAFPEVAR